MPLAVIPTGTANDFARANGIPLDIEAAARLAPSGTATRSLELGHLATRAPVRQRRLAPASSSVAGRRAQPLKSRFGPFAYGLGAARAAATGRAAARHASASTASASSTAARGRSWSPARARSAAAPGSARPTRTDGDLDVVIVPAGSRAGLVKRAWGLRTQTIERQRKVAHFEGRVVSVDTGRRRDQL